MTATFFVFILDSAAISTAPVVTVFRANFHKTFGIRQRLETEPGIESKRVPGPEHEPPQALQSRMPEHRGHQLLADTLSALVFDDEDVCQPRERRKIGHDPGKTNLLARL